MVYTAEAMVMGVLIVEITIESDNEMMNSMGMRPQRELQIMNPGEALTTTLDRRRILGFVRVVTLMMMMRKMTGRDDLSQILFNVFWQVLWFSYPSKQTYQKYVVWFFMGRFCA